MDALTRTQAVVEASLADDFNLPAALAAVLELAVATCTQTLQIGSGGVSATVVLQVLAYLQDQCRLLGFQSLSQQHLQQVHSSGTQEEGAAAAPALDAFVDFRDALRRRLIEYRKSSKRVGEAGSPPAVQALVDDLLRVCDTARDVTFPKLGYELTDGPQRAMLTTRHVPPPPPVT